MIMDLMTGDSIITDHNEYLIVSAEGFNLISDENVKVKFILIDVKHGSTEGYDDNLDNLWKYYNIKSIIKNNKSFERTRSNNIN